MKSCLSFVSNSLAFLIQKCFLSVTSPQVCLLLRVTASASILRPCFASQTGQSLQGDFPFSHGLPLLQSNLETRDGTQSFSDSKELGRAASKPEKHQESSQLSSVEV